MSRTGIALFLLWMFASEARAGSREEVDALLKRDRVTYGGVNKVAIEAISAVKPISGAYAFLLLKSPDLRDRMGRAARQMVVQRFDIKAIAKEYSSIYSSLGSPVG